LTGEPSPFHVELLSFSERGDGRQAVWCLAHGDRRLIVKMYGLKRGRLRTALRHLGQVTYARKTSMTARGRCRTERQLLQLWREAGIRVPALIEPPNAPPWPAPVLFLEFIPGPILDDVIRDPNLAAERKEELIFRLGAELGRRHHLARERCEARLFHHCPTLKHVIVAGERLAFFDLEIAHRPRRDVSGLAVRETLGFLRSLAKSSGDAFPSLLRAFLDGYPEPDSLLEAGRRVRRLVAPRAIGRWLGLSQAHQQDRKMRVLESLQSSLQPPFHP
jgi:tRNA A-37 threonylcarbamoyl transferase component Bud32